MKYRINNAERQLEAIDDNGNVQVIAKFINKEKLQDRAYTLYAYVEVVDDRLYIKFGKAKDQSIYDRYHRGTSSKANDQMIAIWASDKGDEEIHKILQISGSTQAGFIWADKEILNTIEAYQILTLDGYKNILGIITREAGESAVAARYYREDYEDIKELVNFILAQDKKFFCTDLCTRWGKTATYNLLFKKYNALGIRINILTAYVGTVKRSYSAELIELTNNKNALFIDTDQITENTLAEIIAWLKDAKHYVIYYLPLTGDEASCFDRRAKLLKNLKKYRKSLVIEEADFGCCCPKQIEKLKGLYNATANQIEKIFVTTGTKIDKTKNIFIPECYIKRDYIIDVLARRDNAVGINWMVLNNSEMVKLFGYCMAEMENWNEIFTVEGGQLKNELYLRDLINILFNKSFTVNTPANRKYARAALNILNDAVTMWWTPVGKEAQQLLKKLIEEVAPGYRVEVINGDETTNADAELKVKTIINTTGTKLILISSGMASRSFSIKEIKNIILTCNSGDSAAVVQKCFRGCTPWTEHPEMRNNIIDFRLEYAEPALASYLSGIAVDSLSDTATKKSTKELLEILMGTDKLRFSEYFTAGADPIRSLSADEISIMLESKDYVTARAIRVITTELDSVDMPTNSLNEKLNWSGLTNTNIKGDSCRKIYAPHNTTTTTGKTKEQLEEDKRIQYLAYLLNHKEVFNSYKYEENIFENEFKNNMPIERQSALENCLGLEMKIMIQIAQVLIKNNIKILD